MDGADGRVVFEIDGDNKGAKKSVEEVVTEAKKAGKEIDQAVKDTSDKAEKDATSAIKGIVAAISAAAIAKKILDFGKAAVEAASDLREVQNVVDVTFGEGADKIESWAKKAGTQFGLTEIQAKKFTSTLGAMMKSSGLAGPEIVEMSTDLAGLAADMASFYNLDFETAFQKIRSGISGETEPLKQLGINMSVANLQAYALSKGITTAFDKMSQGQQTMLRYQYLMQATADAQGDFARTSDGMANGLRMLSTNFDQLKLKIGNALMPAVESAIGGINRIIAAMLTEKPETVLDEFAAIDLQTDTKIAQIQATTKEAGELLGILTSISTTSVSKATASSAEQLASAFNSLSTTEDKREAWSALLTTLSGSAEAIAAISGQSVEDVQEWLGGIAESANTLDPASADSWVKLFSALTEGLPDDEGTKTIAEALEQTFLAMGSKSEAAAAGLAGLGYTSDEIKDKQARWLEVCKRLVNTIPGLNEVINTETGEVIGGVGAIQDYVQAWEDGQKRLAYLKALQAKKDALAQKEGDLFGFQLDADVAARAANKLATTLEERLRAVGLSLENFTDKPFTSIVTSLSDAIKQSGGQFDIEQFLADYKEYLDLADKARGKRAEYIRQQEAYDQALADYGLYEEAVEARLGDLTDAEYEAAAGAEALTQAQIDAGAAAVQAAGEAFTALNDYIKGVRDATEQSVKSVVNGFDEILTPAQRKIKELEQQLEAAGNSEAGKKIADEIDRIKATGTITTAADMQSALQSQLDFISEYQRNLDRARAAGVSDLVLASLSDGSVESAEYLAALAGADTQQIQAINAMYAEIQTQSEGFVDALTAQKLAADETFNELVATAAQTVEQLDLASSAETAMKSTVEGIAQGIADAIPSVQAQVDALLAVLGQLSGYNGSIGVHSRWGSLWGNSFTLNGTHANGLDYVPFNGYLAQLHEGESILTAEEARIWRDFKFGQKGTMNVDYDAIGGMMRDNMRGGNVYLDGQTVGRVISARQADSYRQLERSGWMQ